ncbi:MAG: hypothetical protein CMD92_02915 [Gammaproteobacteria bacterium]|nr:hypothetical protein [Gammaproteobacteria bacterium]
MASSERIEGPLSFCPLTQISSESATNQSARWTSRSTVTAMRSTHEARLDSLRTQTGGQARRWKKRSIKGSREQDNAPELEKALHVKRGRHDVAKLEKAAAAALEARHIENALGETRGPFGARGHIFDAAARHFLSQLFAFLSFKCALDSL